MTFLKTKCLGKICLYFAFTFLVGASSDDTTTPTRVTTSSDTTMAAAKGILNVTIVIFSGRRDPEWQVLPTDPNYNEIERLLTTARAGGFILDRFKDMPARLGYKGFLIQDATKENARPDYIFGPHTAALQQLLLKILPSEFLSDKLRENLSEEIGKEATARAAEGQEVTTPSDSTNAPTAPGTTSGKLKVTLAIFSGLPDPQWEVLTTDPKYDEIKQLLNTARTGGFIYGLKKMPSRLGYKGFLIQDTVKETAQPELIVGPDTVELQQLLLKTMPDGTFPEDFRKEISKQIEQLQLK